MAFDGYFVFDGSEIINVSRIETYDCYEPFGA